MNTTSYTQQLEQLTKEFEHEFGLLTEAQLNWKPNPCAWSIAQNLHHLIVLNESYYPTFAALGNGSYSTPWTAKIGFLVNFFGKMILNSVQPDRKRKMKTFGIWEPSASNFSADVLQQFARHQQELQQKISGLSGPLSANAVISSPANKNIVYRLGTALDILITHERRHLEQAREVLASLPATIT